MLSVQFADIWLDALGKSEMRCENYAIYKRSSWACARMQSGSGAEVEALMQLALAQLELTPPPNFFMHSCNATAW